MSGHTKVHDLTPLQVKAGLEAGDILLIDVREPDEFAAERIAGALNAPLSTFNPQALPQGGAGRVVFQCAGGKRSAAAVDRCASLGGHDAHLAGGLAAWKAAGLPTIAGA